ncbi:MAG TPA: GNAT family N-acetyltransferase [Thermohalobaculum sp.]|nr:GNAT family N-acetyltransferase [Thermohalobaculum sp.]
MVRVIVPDVHNAERLAEIARVAFEGRASHWTADDFVALGGPPHTALIVDDAFQDGLLILRMAADEAEILNFGVVPAAQRRGLGRALLRSAEALAQEHGMTSIFLEVAVDNAPARALYAGRGYAELGNRKDYYLRPDGTRADALVMKKLL